MTPSTRPSLPAAPTATMKSSGAPASLPHSAPAPKATWCWNCARSANCCRSRNRRRLFQRCTLKLRLSVSSGGRCRRLVFVVLAAAHPIHAQPEGAVEKMKVHGKSLEANLEDYSPDRDVFV